MIRSDPTTAPRLLTTNQVAAYLGFARSIAKLVKAGVIPPPIPSTKKWDRYAVDAALDRLSGLARQTG